MFVAPPAVSVIGRELRVTSDVPSTLILPLRRTTPFVLFVLSTTTIPACGLVESDRILKLVSEAVLKVTKSIVVVYGRTFVSLSVVTTPDPSL